MATQQENDNLEPLSREALNDFSTSGVEWFDLTNLNSELKGFVGGLTHNNCDYYVPNNDGANRHGRVVRVVLNDFSTSIDLTNVNSELNGFVGGLM